jgi:hypothetical protein
MAFLGGALSTIGTSFLTQTATQAASAGFTQVFQGSGQSFFGSAGQALAGNLAGSAVNIALNSVFKTQVTGPGGIKLDSGANILASTITPYVTSTVAAGINQSIQKSLQSAGPFGPVLSTFATTTVNQLFNGLSNSLTAGSSTGTGYGNKTFPGAGSEPPADYAGGNAYTLGSNGGDVVFSIQPANQGPQAFGLNKNASIPSSATSVATKQVAGNSGTAESGVAKAANTVKAEKMAQSTSGVTAYDKAILRFMSKGTPTSKAEIAKLKPEELTALNDTLKATGGKGLEALPITGYFGSWTFITAPEDVSWDVANAANRVSMFGTNNPPVVAGSRGMRDLSLGNALVEGFVRGVTVEGKISALEKLLNYNLNASDGFVSVPVYQVWANNKSYGGSEAYYIIKDVKIKETMRDLKGDATRAYVDISFMQVPSYQVGSGRDLASAKTAAARSSILINQRQVFDAQKAAAGQVDGSKQSNINNPANREGPKAGGKAKPAKARPSLYTDQRPVIRTAPPPPPQGDGST